MANIVISGASRGIGFALTQIYVEAGNRVFAWCRNPQKAEALNRLAAASDGRLTVVRADVANDAEVEAAAAALDGEKIDILVNVAGIYHNDIKLEKPDFSAWHESFEVMVVGPFRVTMALLPNLVAARGKVMTVSSQMGASTYPGGGTYSYGAAKAGINRAMKSLAFDLREKGVSIGLVHPGYVQTDMGGAGADITPRESAAGIRGVIDRMNIDNSGGFYKWSGEPHAW